jgi:hypothetical protein
VFANSRKRLLASVWPSARPHVSSRLVKCDTGARYENLPRKSKCENNVGHFTWRPMCVRIVGSDYVAQKYRQRIVALPWHVFYCWLRCWQQYMGVNSCCFPTETVVMRTRQNVTLEVNVPTLLKMPIFYKNPNFVKGVADSAFYIGIWYSFVRLLCQYDWYLCVMVGVDRFSTRVIYQSSFIHQHTQRLYRAFHNVLRDYKHL